MFTVLCIIIGAIIYLCVGEFLGTLFDLDGTNFLFFWPAGLIIILVFLAIDWSSVFGRWLRIKILKKKKGGGIKF